MSEIFTLFFLLFTIAACHTTPPIKPTEDAYRSLLNGWLGRSKTSLFQVWGEPQHDYWKKDVNYVLYVKSAVANTSEGAKIERMPRIAGEHAFYQNPQGLVSKSCTTLFKLEEGVITSWKFEGNACVAF